LKLKATYCQTTNYS